jgi:CysZ protein
LLIRAAFAAWRQVLSGPLRRILWKSLALTIGLLVLLWFGMTRLFAWWLKDHTISTAYPWLDTVASFLAGAGILPRRSGRDRRAHRLPE